MKLILLVFLIVTGCGPYISPCANASEPELRQTKRATLVTHSKYPQVKLRSYTLIADDIDAKRSDAEAVMQVKIELPRAVQTKDVERFERILARNFVFHAIDEFFGRADYIRARAHNKDTVMTAEYENVVLRFMGDLAFLTYRNTVVDEPGGLENTTHMSWADILVKEDGQWKFVAVHEIDSRREEKPNSERGRQ